MHPLQSKRNSLDKRWMIKDAKSYRCHINVEYRSSNSLRDDDKKIFWFFFQFNDRALFHLFVERETEELLVCNKWLKLVSSSQQQQLLPLMLPVCLRERVLSAKPRAGPKRPTPPRTTHTHTWHTTSDVILQCRHFLHLISLFNRLIRWHTSTAVFIHLTGLFSIILIKGHHPKRPGI